MKSLLALGLAAGLLCAAAPASRAASEAALSAPTVARSGGIILAADGCGWGWYRGPGGACHRFGTGPYPGGYYAPYYNGYYAINPNNGCPAGWWRGPWGHCRNTPYHGRLPGGGWQ